MHVYITVMGERYEGGHVSAVHQTEEGAISSVNAYIAETRLLEKGLDGYDPGEWITGTNSKGESYWSRGIDRIRIERWPVS